MHFQGLPCCCQILSKSRSQFLGPLYLWQCFCVKKSIFSQFPPCPIFKSFMVSQNEMIHNMHLCQVRSIYFRNWRSLVRYALIKAPTPIQHIAAQSYKHPRLRFILTNSVHLFYQHISNSISLLIFLMIKVFILQGFDKGEGRVLQGSPYLAATLVHA